MPEPIDPLTALRRQGVVTQVDWVNRKVLVEIGGDTNFSVWCDYLATYAPAALDTVVVLSNSGDHLVLGPPGWQMLDSAQYLSPTGSINPNKVFSAYTVGAAIVTCTTTTYVDMTNANGLLIVKREAYTDLLVTMMGSAFTNSAAGSYYMGYGVSIAGTDYDIGRFYFNPISTHLGWGSAKRISGIGATALGNNVVVTPRIKNSVAAKSTVMDANDQLTLIVEEVVP